MKTFGARECMVVAGACVAILFGGVAQPKMCSAPPMGAMPAQAVAGAETKATPVQGEKPVTEGTILHAKGTFEPTVKEQGAEDKTEGSTLGRWTLAKTFHGDLEGTSEGQMLAASTSVKGSAGYVAMERVTGTLNGRSGSFVLQHSGTMSHGAFQLSVSVVPDSGTAQLAGIAGKMEIQIAADGKHSYVFDYTLPEKQ